MDWQELGYTALRTSAVYLVMLLVLRLLGKRSVGNLSAFDLLVALMLGEVTDEIAYGDVGLAEGFTVVAIVAVWHFANSWASWRWGWFDRLTGGTPRTLVEHGQIDRDALARERVNEDELWSNLRAQGIDEIEEVKCAVLEPSGQISVVQEEWARPIQKRDLPGEAGQKPAPHAA
jgi:uncharacterized membrane protein YcaP (DUF421 family)